MNSGHWRCEIGKTKSGNHDKHVHLLLVNALHWMKWVNNHVSLCVCVGGEWVYLCVRRREEACVHTFSVLSVVWVPRLFFHSVCLEVVCVLACICVCVCVCVIVMPQRVLYQLSVYELNNALGDSLPLSLLSHFLSLSPSLILTSNLSIIPLFF